MISFLRFTSDETPCEISTCPACRGCRTRCISAAPGSTADHRSLFSIVSLEDTLYLAGGRTPLWDLCPRIPGFGRGNLARRSRWPSVLSAPALYFQNPRRSLEITYNIHRTIIEENIYHRCRCNTFVECLLTNVISWLNTSSSSKRLLQLAWLKVLRWYRHQYPGDLCDRSDHLLIIVSLSLKVLRSFDSNSMLPREHRSVGSNLGVHLILVIDASESRRGGTVSKRSHGSRFTKLNYIWSGQTAWSPRLEIQPWHRGGGDEEPDIAYDFNFALAGSTAWSALANFSTPMGNSAYIEQRHDFEFENAASTNFPPFQRTKLDSRSSPFFFHTLRNPTGRPTLRNVRVLSSWVRLCVVRVRAASTSDRN